MALITIKTYDNVIDAYLFKSKLQSEGIACYIFDQHITYTHPVSRFADGGVKLKINEEDLERARAVYIEMMGSVYTDEAGNAIVCPVCRSNNLHTGHPVRKGRKGFLSWLMALLLAIVPFYQGTVYKCHECSHEFK